MLFIVLSLSQYDRPNIYLNILSLIIIIFVSGGINLFGTLSDFYYVTIYHYLNFRAIFLQFCKGL